MSVPVKKTVAPKPRNVFADEKPTPEVPPVITTFFPLRFVAESSRGGRSVGVKFGQYNRKARMATTKHKNLEGI